MNRALPVIALSLLAGGCLPVLPLPITLASTGLSGITYLATGKSSTDHLLSAAAEEDCVLLRAIIMQDVCQHYDPDEPRPTTVIVQSYPGDGNDALARAQPVATPAASPGTTVAQAPSYLSVESVDSGRPAGDPSMVNSFAQAAKVERVSIAGIVAEVRKGNARITPPVAGARGAQTTAWYSPDVSYAVERAALPAAPRSPDRADVGARDRYLVLGSFRSRERADDLAARLDTVKTFVSEADVHGQLWHRVVAGPMSSGEVDRLQQRLTKVDGRKPWVTKGLYEPGLQVAAAKG